MSESSKKLILIWVTVYNEYEPSWNHNNPGGNYYPVSEYRVSIFESEKELLLTYERLKRDSSNSKFQVFTDCVEKQLVTETKISLSTV